MLYFDFIFSYIFWKYWLTIKEDFSINSKIFREAFWTCKAHHFRILASGSNRGFQLLKIINTCINIKNIMKLLSDNVKEQYRLTVNTKKF